MKISSPSDVKDEVARAVRARPSDRVLFASELTEAIALVARRAPGDVVTRVGIAAVAASGRPEPVVVRWDAETGIDELARQLHSLAENVFEQEKS